MPNSGPTSSGGYVAGRAVLLFVIVAVHLLLVLWLVGRPSPKPVTRPAVLNVFTVSSASGHGASAAPAKRKQAGRARPISVAIVHRPSPIARGAPSVDAVDAAPTTDAAPGGCGLARDAGEAIRQDAAAMAELHALPPTVRTATDAVMLWNGEWLDQGATPAEREAGSLRRVVEQVVADAPAECRDAEATGPVFIPIAEQDHTVMIVIGSGIWRWADLVAPPTACFDNDSTICPPVAPAGGSDDQGK